MRRTGSNDPVDRDFRLIQGLASGTLLSIPLWVGIGVVAAVLTQNEPISGLQTVILFVAAAAELVLLRYSWRFGLRRFPASAPPSGEGSAVRVFRPKPMLQLAGLVGTYLHYYFWDVQLQIASMPAVTVFARASALG